MDTDLKVLAELSLKKNICVNNDTEDGELIRILSYLETWPEI